MLFTNIMTDQKHFKDPEKFMPERWLRGSPAQHSAHPFAFIPFGHGARMCIGKTEDPRFLSRNFVNIFGKPEKPSISNLIQTI